MSEYVNKKSTESEENLLYSHNVGKKTFQWELWKCCNNLCSFCYLGKEARHTGKKRQLKSLSDLKFALSNLDFDKYNSISLIGGEFFQGQLKDADVKKAFMETIEILGNYYLDKKIGSIWISATLTIGDQEDLYETVNLLDKIGVRPNPKYGASGLWICTSWDAKGRFHSENNKLNWEYHMKNLEVKYPWIKKNTTIILTQNFCEDYITGDFIPEEFMKKFETGLFYKSPGPTEEMAYGANEFRGLAACNEEGKINEYLTFIKKQMTKEAGFNFFPKRSTFRKFLIKYAKQDPQTYDRLFNINFRADELYVNFNEKEVPEIQKRNKITTEESLESIESVANPNCLLRPDIKKHNAFYAGYADCNECMICDRVQIWNATHPSH